MKPCPIESMVPIDQYELFVTVTLPKSCYRKSPEIQAQIMKRYLHQVHSNYFEEITGCYELTLKGNVHAHFFGIYRKGLFEGIEFQNKKAQNNANIKLIFSQLKRYSISDVQAIKNHDQLYTYLNKELNVTAQIIKQKPTFMISNKKIEEAVLKRNPTLNQMLEMTETNVKPNGVAQTTKETSTCCLDWDIKICNNNEIKL